MTMCNSISFLFYLFTTRVALGASITVNELYQRNKMVVSKTLAEIPAIGINTCAAECIAFTDCLSVNFNTEQMVCELNTEDANIVDDTQHKYMYATNSQLQTASKVGNIYTEISNKLMLTLNDDPRMLNSDDHSKY